MHFQPVSVTLLAYPAIEDLAGFRHTNNKIIKLKTSGEIISQVCLWSMNMTLSHDVNDEYVWLCMCVSAVPTDAFASASPSECRATCKPGTSRYPQLDHTGSWISEADRWRLAGVHAQPHWSCLAGHVQVLHLVAVSLSINNIIPSYMLS